MKGLIRAAWEDGVAHGRFMAEMEGLSKSVRERSEEFRRGTAELKQRLAEFEAKKP